MKTNILKKSVKKYPELSYRTFFCVVSSFPDITVPFKLTTSGCILSLNNIEYDNLKEWSTREFLPHLPSDVDKSKINTRCLRDIFTQPDRHSKSFKQLVQEIEHKPIAYKTQDGYFTSIEETSTLSVNELILYSLLRLSGFQMSGLDKNQISKYKKVFVDHEDKLKNFGDILEFMLHHSKMMEYRRITFDHIIKSFCLYNSEQLICALNSESFDEIIFDDAEKICENLKSGETFSIFKLDSIFPMIALKYCWPIVNDKLKHWNAQFESETAYFCTTEPNNPPVITNQVYIQNDFTWKAFFKGKLIKVECIDSVPVVDNIQTLLSALQKLDGLELKICKGIMPERYLDVLDEDLHDNYFVKYDKVVGYMEGNFLKSRSCLTFISALSADLCYHCNNMRNNLLSKRYRDKKRKPDTDHQTVPLKHRRKDELVTVCISLKDKCRLLQQQVDRMKGKASEEIENNETHPTTTKKRLLDYGYAFKNLTSTNSKLADHGKATRNITSSTNSKLVDHEKTTRNLAFSTNSELVDHEKTTRNLASSTNSELLDHGYTSITLPLSNNQPLVLDKVKTATCTNLTSTTNSELANHGFTSLSLPFSLSDKGVLVLDKRTSTTNNGLSEPGSSGANLTQTMDTGETDTNFTTTNDEQVNHEYTFFCQPMDC